MSLRLPRHTIKINSLYADIPFSYSRDCEKKTSVREVYAPYFFFYSNADQNTAHFTYLYMK